MRITAGTFKGKILASPDGLATRPTSDRARQAVFNILTHASWCPGVLDDAAVMDVFAGTGALGLEALSRGAAEAVFIENDRAALAACRANITAMGLSARAIVMPQGFEAMPPRPATTAPRTLVFLDPPYGKGLGAAALAALATKDWLAQDAVCVLEMAKKQPEETPAGFDMQDERHYGVALVRFLRRKAH